MLFSSVLPVLNSFEMRSFFISSSPEFSIQLLLLPPGSFRIVVMQIRIRMVRMVIKNHGEYSGFETEYF